MNTRVIGRPRRPRPCPGGRGLGRVAGRRASVLRRGADPARLPDPPAAGAREAARLPRQRGHHAEAAGGDRRDRQLLRARQRQHPPRRPPAERAGDAGLRARPRDGPALPQRPRGARDRLRPRHHRGDQPGGADLRAAAAAAGRRDRGLGDGAPLEHRPVADGVRADRGAAPRRADHRRRRAADGRVRAAARRPHEARRRRPRVERARHDQPGGRDRPARARARASRSWSTARRRCPTCPWTCRRSTATSTRSRATRCSGRPASACSTARRRSSKRCRRTRAAAT